MKRLKMTTVKPNEIKDWIDENGILNSYRIQLEFYKECKNIKISCEDKLLVMMNNFVVYQREQRRLKRNKRALNRICERARKKLWNILWDLMFPNEEDVVPNKVLGCN